MDDKVISGVAFLVLLVALQMINLALGGAGMLLALIVQGMNMSKRGEPESVASASN